MHNFLRINRTSRPMISQETRNEKVINSCLSYCIKYGIPERGMQIAEGVMRSEPARRVRTRGGAPNITSRFPSKKMGVVIQSESKTIEYPIILINEFSKEVLGYWDQPSHKVELKYQNQNGRWIKHLQTMDCFIVSKDFIGFEEYKPYEELIKLAKKYPGRYRENKETGFFEIPPLDSYLQGSGLRHRVIDDRFISKVYVENLRFLYQYANYKDDKKYSRSIDDLRKLIRESGPISIPKLKNSIEDLSIEIIFSALWHQDLFSDIESKSISTDSKTMKIYVDEIVSKSDSSITDSQKDTELPIGSLDEVNESVRRFNLLKQLKKFGGNKTIKELVSEAPVSSRTLYRWSEKYAQELDIQSLLPRSSHKGNYHAKISEEVEVVISNKIKNHYLNNKNKSKTHVYQLVKKECSEKGLSRPSFKTFMKRLEELEDYKSIKIREGQKRAYQIGDISRQEDGYRTKPFRDVSRFLERCHIDHTVMDIEIVDQEGVNLGRPKITLIVDEYSNFVLACFLSFKSASRESLMCAIRLMVLENGVMPEEIVVDGGKEFSSTYFEKLMAKYGCMITSREGKPRAGNAVEGFFGVLDSMFTHNLTGNTTLTKNVRSLSSSHLPKKLAQWTPEAINNAIQKVIEYLNTEYPFKDSLTPSQLRDESIKKIGVRCNRHIEYNERFYIDTLIPPQRSKVKLKRNKPVELNRIKYSHSCLVGVPVEGVYVDLLYDPMNLEFIYVNYKSEWIKFFSKSKVHSKENQHSGLSLAEIFRVKLSLNAKAKQEARMNLACMVEDFDQQQNDPPVKDKSTKDVTPDSSHLEVDAEKGNEVNLWDINIPNSSKLKN